MYPYTEKNLANFTSIVHDPKYFMQAAISQYFIDNFLYELHKNGLIVIDSGDLLNTTLFVSTVQSAAGGTFEGFNVSAPCKVVMSTLDPHPQF